MHPHGSATPSSLRPMQPWGGLAPVRLPVALAACLLMAPAAVAQGHGHGGGGIGPGASFRERGAALSPGPAEGVRSSGLHLAPSGRWWDDDRVVQTLHLNASQQKRMDDIFSENRTRLIGLYKDLDRELGQLDRLGRARTLDEAQIFAQIDRVNQVRGDLEKATAHYQLQLRKEMTTDQTVRMDGLRPDAPAAAASEAPPAPQPPAPQPPSPQ